MLPIVATKTGERNDLIQRENQDLISTTNRMRVIVTKAALQEGWDCHFADVLCSLASASNLSAMTQLVGHVLRQPHALKTGNALLDECYVVTHHAETAGLVGAINGGLERDGLADLVLTVAQCDPASGAGIPCPVQRRPDFKKRSKSICPRFCGPIAR